MSRANQQAYRERLKAAGRKEILIDLPETLISDLDARRCASTKRSAYVEQLIKQALAGDSKETA